MSAKLVPIINQRFTNSSIPLLPCALIVFSAITYLTQSREIAGVVVEYGHV